MAVGNKNSQIFLFYFVIFTVVVYVLYRMFFSWCSATNNYLHEQLMHILM